MRTVSDQEGAPTPGEPPDEPGRSLLGYRRSAVQRLLADRDVRLMEAEKRIQSAQAAAERLDAETANLREANARLQDRIRELEEAGPGGGQTAARFLNEELATILTAAEESASRVIDRARQSAERQVAEAGRLWREAQEQMSRFAAWRDRVDPMVRSARGKLDEVRARIEEVPELIREALTPLADAIGGLDEDLAGVAGASTPPLMVTPSAIEPGDEEPQEQARAAGATSE
jgi:chromosome segregation ATPase